MLRRVTLTSGKVLEADLVFFAVGRAPRTQGSASTAAGVETAGERRVVVDGENTTSLAHIFAIGDVSEQAQPHPGRDRRGPPPRR